MPYVPFGQEKEEAPRATSGYVPFGGDAIQTSLDQKKTDESAINAAVKGMKLVWRLNAEGAQKALDYYGKAQSAIFAGTGNIVSSAFGDDYFEPIRAATEGFQFGAEPGAVTEPVFRRLRESLPDINAEGYNEIVKYGVPFSKLLPEIPDTISPEIYTKPISKAAELAVDVVLDPLLLTIGPTFKGLSAAAKITGLKNLAKSTVKKGISLLPKKMVDTLEWAFTTRGGRDVDFLHLLDKYDMAEKQAKASAAEALKVLSDGLSKHEQMQIGLRARGAGKALAPKLEEKAQYARNLLNQLHAESHKEKFISDETFFRNIGVYFPTFYRSREMYEHLLKKWGRVEKSISIGGQRFLKKKVRTLAERKKLGEIIEPAYPVAKAMQQVKHDLNVNNLFKSLEKNPEWILPKVEKGMSGKVVRGDKVYKQVKSSEAGTLPGQAGAKWGRLEGKYIRDDILRELKQVYHIPSKLEKIYLKALSTYKLMKVLPNPATHSRNIMGAALMLDLSPTGKGTLATLPKKLIQAGKEIKGKGKYFDELIQNGAWHEDFFHADLAGHLDSLNNVDDVVGALEIAPNTILAAAKKYGIKGAKKGAELLGKLYSGEDNIFKMAHYLHARTKMGMDVPQAIEYMRKWGFDYSRVSPAVQFIRNSLFGSPFITYQAKALPRIAEVIMTNPARFFKWPVIFDAIDRMSTRAHNLTDADVDTIKKNTRGQGMLLPWTDSKGNPLSLDLTYLLPWGDLQESGGLFGMPPSLTMSNPFLTIPAQLAFNKNIYMDAPIVTDLKPDGSPRLSSDENWKNWWSFVYKSIMPAVAPGSYSWEKVARALSPIPEHRLSKSGKPYDLGRILLDVIFGLKTRGIDVDETTSFDKLGLNVWKRERESRMRKIALRQDLTDDEKEELLEKERSLVIDTIEKELTK